MEKLKHGDTFQGRVLVSDIQISFIHPPIPDRNMDWQATRSGYDEGDPIGRGRTPVVALADLLEKEEEHS